MMLNLLLLIFSYILYILFGIVSFVYTHFKFLLLSIKSRNFEVFSKNIRHYYYIIALGVDRAGNPLLSPLFNDLAIRPDGHRAGDSKETISYVLKENKRFLYLYPFGMFLSYLINAIASLFKNFDHIENSDNE